MAYDPILMAELIKKLSSAQKKVADAQGELDFYLRLIAQNAEVFGKNTPEILDGHHRKTILALVQTILGNKQPSYLVTVGNGKGASDV